MADLDSILSGASAVASEPEKTVETPAVVEQAQAETGAEQTSEQTGAEGEGGGQKMVPHEALHAEKQKVKRYTEEVAEFRQTIAEMKAANERQMAELFKAVAPKPAEAEKPKPEIWDDADGFINERLAPVQEQVAKVAERFSMRLAVKEHGKEVVEQAYQALGSAMQAGDPRAQAEYQRIRASDDPYEGIVQWHKNEQQRAELADPVALREKIKAEVLAELQGGTQQQAEPAAVMPSNLAGARNVGSRSGPAWSGPQPLNDIFDRTRSPRV